MGSAVHRVIEDRARLAPHAAAIVDAAGPTTYRDLNLRANTLARRLQDSGLTRGSLALVRMPRGADLAAVLLAVLKAGACYAWIEPGSADDVELPASFCIVRGRASAEGGPCLALDISAALRESAARPTPNLPVLTRGTDAACVLADASGQPHVIVPHATITALPQTALAGTAAWRGEPGALDLWLGLMSGATLAVAETPATRAAA